MSRTSTKLAILIIKDEINKLKNWKPDNEECGLQVRPYCVTTKDIEEMEKLLSRLEKKFF